MADPHDISQKKLLMHQSIIAFNKFLLNFYTRKLHRI